MTDIAPARLRALKELLTARGARYHQATFRNFRVERPQQKTAESLARGYCLSLERNVKEGRSLVFYGPAGTGKDHLMTACMRAAVLNGYDVRWAEGDDLLASFRQRIDDPSLSEDGLMCFWSNPSILAVSDPVPAGNRELTDFQLTCLYRVLERRYSNLRPTWVTVNAKDRADLERRLSPQAADRLLHDAVCVPCVGQSFRKPMKGG